MFFTWWEIRETNTTCKALKDGIWIAVHITVFDSCMGTKINSSRFITLSVWECLIICNFGLFFIMDVTFPRLVWSLSWSLLLVDGDLAGGFNSVSLESEGSGGPRFLFKISFVALPYHLWTISGVAVIVLFVLYFKGKCTSNWSNTTKLVIFAVLSKNESIMHLIL